MNLDQPETQSRQITVLRAVITGFDELSQNGESAGVNEVVNKCYELLSSVISLYGGSIDLFTGRETMAFFGVPEPVDKAPLKAIGAAIDMVSKIADLRHELESASSIGIKIGINTGPVTIGEIGKDTQARDMVMGETVSTVSRICDIAENGQILSGKETYDAAKDRFEFLVMEPMPLKGSKTPLPLFEVKGRKRAAISTGTGSSRMISSAMVGRDKELKLLEKQFMQLINGRGSVVYITGSAGIGKSRLMAEMREKELVSKLILLEGRAISNGKDLSFHPIVRIIKSWTGIKEEDSAEDSLNKLQRAIHRAYPEASDEIFPFIATMMGYHLEGKAKERIKGIEGEALENLILKNLRDLLSRAASIRPVVIVIEDAHWCDISSVIFLESLFKLARKQRILFVCVFRPGHMETGERIRKFAAENLQDHLLEINIEPLSEKDSEELIMNLLNNINLPEEINRLIIDRAAGNPFFIEEVIRSFIDEGLIEIKNDKFLLSENIKYANIPESIDHVLLSRIDRLDEKTKELLSTASVIGRNFYYKVLEEAAVTIEEVDQKLEYLKDVQLINERKNRDEVEFLFKHALAQQATYESIMEKTKKELHLKIANSIEKVFAGRIHEFYGMLAHHYFKAGQNLKAEEYLIKAGDEYIKSGAASEAVSYLKRALEIQLQNPKNDIDETKVVELQEKLGYACFYSGQFVETVENFEKVITFYSKPMPKTGIRMLLEVSSGIILLRIVIFLNVKAKGKAEPVTEKLWNIININGHALTTIDPRRIFIESLCGYARLLRKSNWGKREAAIMLSTSQMLFYNGILVRLGKKLMDYALTQLDEKHVTGWMNGLLSKSMYLYFTSGKFSEFDEEKMFNNSIQIGEYWIPSTFYVYNGYSAIESGNQQIVMHYLNRLKTLGDAFDNRFPEIQYHRLRTEFSVKYRRLDEAEIIAKEALEFASKTDYKMQMLLLICLQSMVFSFMHEFDKARNSLSEAEKLLKDFRITFCHIHYLIATCYLKIEIIKKDPSQIIIAREALSTTKKLIKLSRRVRKSLPEAYRLRAIIFQIMDNSEKALRNFKKSINSARLFDGNLELSRTYFEAGKFMRDPKNKKDRILGMNGTECLLKARSMFEEMNLQWDLAEYEKYIGNQVSR